MTKSSKKQIINNLREAFLQDGEMHHALYEYELEEHIDYWYDQLKADRNEYAIVITENNGHVAMVLIQDDKTLYINEAGREKLKKLWFAAYKQNMEMFIPMMAQDLFNGYISVTGVNTVNTAKRKWVAK